MDSGIVADFKKAYEKNFGGTRAATALAIMDRALEKVGVDKKRYQIHNIGVAKILMGLGMDESTTLAGLLHNSIRLGASTSEVKSAAGEQALGLIDSKERFEKALLFTPHDKDNARKKILAVITADPKVAILQFAETLEKLRKISSMTQEEREKSREKFDSFVEDVKTIFAPLAHKLGMYSISAEMLDLAFKHQEPGAYADLEAGIGDLMKKRREGIEKAKKEIKERLRKAGIKTEVSGRIKNIYSTYQKMKRKRITLGEVYDLKAIRVITKSVKECYEALGIVHGMWNPIPGEFDDYIARPKENGYRALHTSVYTQDMTPLEIQIRTSEMHDYAELGVASHWVYKGGKKDDRYEKKIEWMKQLLGWDKFRAGSTEANLFGKEIFSLTPKGEVINLPEGSTALDFAYAVHTDIGEKCQSAKINGVVAPLNKEIKNGDVVEIITSTKQKPKVAWLSMVKSEKAKQKIRAKLNIKATAKGGRKEGSLAHSIKTSSNRIRLAKCCTPLPGDDIMGFKTTKRKISVHRKDCKIAEKISVQKVDVDWSGKKEMYRSGLVVHAQDRLGLLKDLLTIFSKNKVSVSYANARLAESKTCTCRFELKVTDLAQLNFLAKKIQELPGVLRVNRV